MSTSKVVTRADLKAVLDEVLPSVAVDYVVEQGTSGIWTYRKWNSGIAECWGTATGTINIASAWGGLYLTASNISQSFPTDLFNATPIAQAVDRHSTTAFVAGNGYTSKDACQFLLARGTSQSNASYALDIYAIGRWK